MIASNHLARSAEQGYPMFFARATTLQAIHHHAVRQFNPNAREHHWGQRKLKRDE